MTSCQGVVAEDEFLMIRRLCLHVGVGAILLAWVRQARHFGRKAFAERLVLLFACALRSPHQVRENPAGQTPSDLGGVRVIHAQQSAAADLKQARRRTARKDRRQQFDIMSRGCRRRRIPDDPQIVSARRCGGNSACVGPSGQTLRKKGFCRTSCFAVCVCLKIPSPGS